MATQLEDLQKILADFGLDADMITHMKSLAIQKKDKSYHIRLWRPMAIDIMDERGKPIEKEHVWVQTGWLNREQVELYILRGYVLEPPKDAVFPHGYRYAVTNMKTMKTSWVKALDTFKGRKEAPERKAFVYKPDGKMTIQQAKDRLSGPEFKKWCKKWLDLTL